MARTLADKGLPARPYDRRAQEEDRRREQDTRGAYAEVASAADRRKSPVAQLQALARFWLRWDKFFKRPQRRAANALKQLAGVPLTNENVTWMFEQSLRLAFRDALFEQAEAENPDAENSLYTTEEHYSNHTRIRSLFFNAIRIDATEQDIQEAEAAVERGGKALQEVSKPGDDED